MFFRKDRKIDEQPGRPAKVASEAEGLYRSGRMHCSEAVLEALRLAYAPQQSAAIVQMAAGFGGGSGTGCICGAMTGATMGLGLVLADDRKKAMALTKELHRWFTATYGSACCRVIKGKSSGICPELTGEVAGKAAQLLERG